VPSTALTSKVVPAMLTFLLLPAGGFLLGGTWGKLTIPAGSGLAGGATAAVYALGGALLSVVVGMVVLLKVDPRRLWPVASIAAAFAALGLVAFLIVPPRTLPATPYEPRPVFEPGFVLSLMADPDAPRASEDPLDLPFDRLDVVTEAGHLRAFPRGGVAACTADLDDFAALERVRAAAAPVRAGCGEPGGCVAGACRACAPYKLLFMQAGDSAVWHDISGVWLVSDPRGGALVEALLAIWEAAQPAWTSCAG
jgi:hypothetical protein